jgi:hypothetical protein
LGTAVGLEFADAHVFIGDDVVDLGDLLFSVGHLLTRFFCLVEQFVVFGFQKVASLSEFGVLVFQLGYLGLVVLDGLAKLIGILVDFFDFVDMAVVL